MNTKVETSLQNLAAALLALQRLEQGISPEATAVEIRTSLLETIALLRQHVASELQG